ncbi:PIG-U-domain-containing protein [Macrolepiota fuliginosa MF-IS2]|uniref:PIG-U-domain-containing protein n=1 Tax=Macrolepiota fuliginosa MF-IS2 TaxID=1400762 RepID=A0A9P5XKX7_9AGAR|nr:PIG-U-domain-containing protein [Macrolepiota fuliginosa MF-IS2]
MSSKPLAEIKLSAASCAIIISRVACAFLGLSGVLKHDQLLSTSLSSYSQLKEGVFLFRNGLDPYSGGNFRHSPLLLALFSVILPESRTSASLIWTSFDLTGAWALISIWKARQNVGATSKDALINASYLLNPYVFLPTLALSSSTLQNTLTLLSIKFAAEGRASPSLFLLSILLHVDLSTILLLLPILLLLITDPHSHLASPHPLTANLRRTIPLFGKYILYTSILAIASTIITGGVQWIPQTWGATLTLPDLKPNPGMWWYFFTEIFDHFRPFFLMVFSVHLLIYVVPICIKFQYDPLYATFLLLGVLGTFKAYPTLSDPGLFLSTLAVFPEVFSYLRHPIVTALLHLHAALLMPLFNHLWLNTGTGNANFFYASTLVFACANGAALIDAIWAGMRIAIGREVQNYVVVQE